MEKIINNFKKVLIAKNKRYGNSVLEPLSIFPNSNNVVSNIHVRLEDKLKRIKNGSILLKNDVSDVTGYLWLLSIQLLENANRFNKGEDIIQKINLIEFQLHKFYNSFNTSYKKLLNKYQITNNSVDLFTKKNIYTTKTETLLSMINEHKQYDVELILVLIISLFYILKRNGWTTFDDQID